MPFEWVYMYTYVDIHVCFYSMYNIDEKQIHEEYVLIQCNSYDSLW